VHRPTVEFFPQMYTWPSVVSITLCSSPAAICTHDRFTTV
jgi:hypothetical protein